MRETGRAQDLEAQVDDPLLRHRRLAGHDLLQRTAGQALHRDVVRPLVLTAIEDADHVGMLEARGRARLAPEALDEFAVLGEAPVQDLERDLAAEMRVLGQVDVGHPAGADAAHDPIAAVDHRACRHLGHRFLSSTWSTRLASGAATVPPCPDVRSTVTAIAILGLSTGAKAMNQAWFCPPETSAVPVLPATLIPDSAPAVPVPSSTTRLIICASRPAALGDITRACCAGSIRSLTRPSLRTMRSVRRGRISLPWFPIAAATSAIWSGVTSRRSWPIATRPMSTAS